MSYFQIDDFAFGNKKKHINTRKNNKNKNKNKNKSRKKH